MSDQVEALADLWEWFATTQCRGYSGLYEQVCSAVGRDPDALELVRSAPPAAHLPTVLLGAVHYLLLDGLGHPLADVYAGRSDADPAPLFIDICHTHRDALADLLATRHTQTNDCGRSAVIGPGLTWLASRFDAPTALVDVGASAGLNLLCDQYRLDYGEHGVTGPADSPVEIHCHVAGGRPPIARRLPPLAARVGIDRSPIDLTDPDDARWLLACVWPDTGRLERTAASIRLAQQNPPRLIASDANAALPGVLAELPDRAAAIVLTTWAFGYFSVEQRQRFTELLRDASHERPVAWLSADAPGTVEPFADAPVPVDGDATPDVLGAVTYRGGEPHAELLGFVRQHGSWIDWRAETTRAA